MTALAPLFVGLPLAGAFLAALLGRRYARFPEASGVVTALVVFVLSLLALVAVHRQGAIVYAVGAWEAPLGITMVLDGFSVFMLVTVNLVALLVTVFSLDYMRRFTAGWLFYTLFLLMLAGMNGVVVSGDMFNLFVFLEVAAVSSYVLVAFGTGKHELEAAFKYAVMGTLGSLFILLGVALLYARTSTLNMADMANVIVAEGGGRVLSLVSALVLAGFGLKAAAVPFHAWLPDAHPSAPAPISAMLSGVLIKSLGVYALCRVFFTVIGFTPQVSSILMFLGVVSMLAGVFLAVGQWDLKRLLAYHSISQIGYVLLGIGLGTPLGIAGGLFHLFNHSLFKSLLFLDSGAIEYATGTRDLKRMGGLSRKMPVTSSTTFVASMSIAGIPPFNGFWSKLVIIVAAVEVGRYGYAFLAVLASVLTLASFTKVLRYAFQGRGGDMTESCHEVPVLMRAAMIALAALCLVGGLLLLPGPREYFIDMAGQALTDTVHTATVISEVR